ncbi:hypothetical protein DFJ58DRAFT_665775 [Suillus subalutaceus]|uniref:uncharacterized protein n=1 Tax=Suillus subalutaceus TaxID=48586 RepID=UPI001B85F77A|nr:uncharacterized protein DFJ58DRAFT_665775 [Suillus subalutaceus]KAG1842635.1 hypothetical protein DFJ58DRAFT_665775 [Suillus subalutaceus]
MSSKFTSMLLRDMKCHKLDAVAESQARLNAHLSEKKPKDCVVPYSDALFQEAAIQWLIETDQIYHFYLSSIQKHAYLCEATNEVKIPGQRQIWRAIIALFKCNLTNLRNWLLVCIPIHVLLAC